MTNRSLTLPANLKKTVFSSSESPHQLLARLEQEGVKHIYIDGGFTIQSFVKANLVDEITITLVPVVLGEGIPLFDVQTKDIELEHLSTKSFDFGFVQLSYKVMKLIL